MRELDAKQITENVAQMCKEAAYYLPKDVYEGLKRGRETEVSPVAQNVLDQIIKNAEIARAEDRPYCQDTGMTIVFLEVGQDLHITGGSLEDAVNEGISKGYTEGYLRKSVVAEPLFNRVNTKDNTPGVIYTKIVPGDKLKITVAPKGFGSENKSGVKMLVPADGVEGVKKAGVGKGFNALTGEYVDMIKAGIVDPAKVTRSALQNAASIAAMVLTTESLVADKPAPAAGPAMPAPGMGGGMPGMM